MHLYPCTYVKYFNSGQHADQDHSYRVDVFGCNTKKKEQSFRCVFGKFSIHQYYVHTTVQRNCTADKIHQEKLEVTSLLRNRDASFSACVSILTRAAYGIMVIWL